MTSTMSPERTSARVDFRSASARLRENAGIRDTGAVAAVASVAEVGAAARRLRASNTFTEPTVEPIVDPLDDEAPIVIDLPACEVIYLDPQIGRRKLAAAHDSELRRASLAARAVDLLATIDQAKQALVPT